MSIPLLETKIHAPPSRGDLVPRQALVQRLQAGIDGKLTLLCAPAGSGKTTLVCAWLVEAGCQVAWLSLDRADDDPVRFYRYLVAALQQVDPHLGSGVQRLLEVDEPELPEMVVSLLVSDIVAYLEGDASSEPILLPNPAGNRGPGLPLLLVLDDYQAISDPSIHHAVALLLEHQPAAMHLVITTRHDPPFPLALLRGRGQLTEMRQADLRFSRAETAQFLNQTMGLDLAEADIASLDERTEGWITGLQLAALSMAGWDPQAIGSAIDAFSGRHHFVLDYLTDQVLASQPEAVQRFLLETSILDRMCGPLCDALTASEARTPASEALAGVGPIGTGRQMLQHLAAANLFVAPLDQERIWYRYHRLFADLLQARLSEDQPQLLPDLHQRAAAWYESNAFPIQSVQHALASGDLDLAAAVMERAIVKVRTWSRLDVTVVLDWLDALPNDVVRARPWLALFASRALFTAGRAAAAHVVLDDLEAGLDSDPSVPDAAQVLQRILADRASYAAVRGQAPEAEKLAHRFLSGLDARDAGGQMRATAILGMAYLRSGQVRRAGRAFQRAIRHTEEAGMEFAAVAFYCNLAEVQTVQGQLRQAQATCEQAIQAGTIEGRSVAATGFAGLCLGKILYERNNLAQAEKQLLDGLGILKQSGVAEAFGNLHAVLALVKQAQGNAAAADASIQQAVHAARSAGIARLTSLAQAYQARIWLARDDLRRAVRWAAEYGQLEPAAYLRDFEDLTVARVLLASGQPEAAYALLDRIQPAAAEAGRQGAVIETLALRALANRAVGDAGLARCHLGEALDLAEPEGYARVFVDCGPAMALLLRQLASRGIHPGYAGQLLSGFAEMQTSGIPTQPLVEPMTARELEVLALLADGLTNAEIMRRLVISLPTVKSHTRSIYGKLGVHDRRAAVGRARVLGILPG